MNVRSLSRLALGIVVLALVGVGQALGATYYISYTDGANGNPGTKVSPWKYHPYMWGWSGSYTHSAGDQFIFKGSDTWPNDCFTLYIQAGGAAGNYDYYGVDKTWYRGSSWVKPKFDAQGIELTRNGGTWDVMVQFAGGAKSYITFDNLDFTGLYWAPPQPFGSVCYITIQSSTYITISNCNFRNWTHASYSGTQYEDQLICVNGSNIAPYTQGCIISNCVFDGENQSNGFGGVASGQAAVFGWGGKILNCVIKNTSGGLFPSGAVAGTLAEIAGCTIGPMHVSYDPTMHHDGIQDNGGAGLYIHDNYFRDIAPVPCFIGAGWGGGNYYVYNNVFDLRTQLQQQPIVFDCQSGGNRFYIYNNTIVAGPNLSFFRANWRPSGGNNITLLDVRNNHLIGEGSFISVDSGVTIASTINQNNITQSYNAAGLAGYTRENWYKPTSTGVPTYNVGQDLSSWLSGALTRDILSVTRPQGSIWDVGAYEWASASNPLPPNTPSNVTPANGATGLSLTPTLTASAYSDSTYPQSHAQFTVKYLGVQVWQSSVLGAVNSCPVPTGYLEPGNTYTWTVSFQNSVSLWSSPSAETSFTTQPAAPPATPTNVSPADGASNTTRTPTLALTAYSDPQGAAQEAVEFQVWDVTGTSLVHQSGTLGATNSYPVPTGILNYGTTFKFWGRYRNIWGVYSAWSAKTSFSVQSDPNLPIGTVQWSAASYATHETNTSVSLTVTRSGGTNGAITSTYSTVNGSATAGHDFTAASGALTWAAGDITSRAVTIQLINSGDTAATNRTFGVTLSSSNGGTPTVASVIITMLPPPPPTGDLSWVSTSYSAAEVAPNVTLAVRRTGGSGGAVSANFNTVNGSALAGHDFQAQSGVLNWGSGDVTTKLVTIRLINSGDTSSSNRTFTVVLSNPTGGATLLNTTSTVTIEMQPPPAVAGGTIAFDPTVYSTTELSGHVEIYVKRIGSTNQISQVAYSTVNGTAVAGTDYAPVSGTLTFTNNSTKTISVPILNSGTVGPTRTFTVQLGTPNGGAVLGAATATVGIAMNADVEVQVKLFNGTIYRGRIGRQQ